MTNLRVGLIGLGMMGKNHLRILSTLEGIDFVGVADPTLQERKEPMFMPLGNTHCFSDHLELLDQGLDYCVIASPTESHHSIAIDVLNADSNCLIEKPLALDFALGAKIKDFAERKSLKVGVGHIERYNSAMFELKTRLQAGEIGEIYQIALRRQGPFPARILDVGVVMDLATHDIDLATWLIGSKFSYVFAKSVFKSGRRHEDLVSINGALENGVAVNILVNWLSPMKERSVVVTGEKGTFVVDALNSSLTLHENGNFEASRDIFLHFNGVSQGKIITYAFPKPEPLFLEHESFRDWILGIGENVVRIEEGLEVVRIASAAIQSNSEKKVISTAL